MSESLTGFFAGIGFGLAEGADGIPDSHISNDINHR